MKLKIRTATLNDMLSKASAGASRNKLIPITQLLGIRLEGGELTLTTTDGTNILRVIEKGIEGQDGFVTIEIDLIYRLIGKLTTEFTEIELTDNNLTIKSNGIYNIDIPLDEEGEIIEFPSYDLDYEKAQEFTLKSEDIRNIIDINKPALATTMENPVLVDYYIGDKVFSTDTFKVCANDLNLLPEDMLLSSDLMDLLGLINDKEFTMYSADGINRFKSSTVVIDSPELDNIEEYPIDAIQGLLDTEFEHSCKISRKDLLGILDRLQIFVSPYDRNTIKMIFEKDKLICQSKQNNGREELAYKSVDNFISYECDIDIELLKSQVEAQTSDEIELFYGHDVAIKMKNEKVTQIVALLQE